MKINNIARSHKFLFLVTISLAIASCVPANRELITPALVTSGTNAGSATGWMELYFTDPFALHAADFEGGPDEALAVAIDRARLSVDVAAYSLNLWNIRDALVSAYQRGVVVRMVMESDNMDTREVQQLLDAGIPVIGDQRDGLMHDKFVVIDRTEVWTGSMNYTASGAYQDNNNLIKIRSSLVAEDYTTEFNEMFVQNLFGPDIGAATPNPGITLDDTPVEIFFSPDDGVAAHILTLLQAAQESIYFMAYSFTANDLGGAIRERAAGGVTVAGVMDDSQINSNQGTEYDQFIQAGLNVRRDGNTGQMHDKVFIIDRSIVITGSYNFTASAEENNDENVVIIHNADIAALYLDEFQRIFELSQP